LFENIRLYGSSFPKLCFRGYKEEYGVSDITVKDLYLNDVALTKLDVTVEANEFCKNIEVCNK
jgi:hypothetical protein